MVYVYSMLIQKEIISQLVIVLYVMFYSESE